ncbi:hypothetical protein GT037_004015 [Alternaria burnsii]|uniref:Uncharacterized protein n=1 Tax=Alternaria burnsii TaxID=1187904 RepID=A0A8H7B6Y5_9PLEO|nr:uncharacterized protein GT037_004015 [Alternaria burnsii]KAF7678634.1 hypothetical protein GT037_004015 [Alternaria burnsii]
MGSMIDDSILEYLGVVVKGTAYPPGLPVKATEGPNQTLEHLKKCYVSNQNRCFDQQTWPRRR